MSCGLSKFSYQKCQTQPFNHRFVISSNYNLLISQFWTLPTLYLQFLRMTQSSEIKMAKNCLHTRLVLMKWVRIWFSTAKCQEVRKTIDSLQSILSHANVQLTSVRHPRVPNLDDKKDWPMHNVKKIDLLSNFRENYGLFPPLLCIIP